MIAPKARSEEVRRRKKPRSASAAGSDTGEPLEDLVKTLRYLPKRPAAFDDLRVEVVFSRDVGYRDIDVTWYVNGRRLISQRDEVLPSQNFEEGDKVQAEVTVRVGDAESVHEGSVVTIGNTPPRILTNPKRITRLDGLRVRAEDPDGGEITYHLKGAPPGLSIGERTGVMRYAPSKTAEGGAFDIAVIARDQGGAESEWRFSVNVSAGSESASAVSEREERRARAREEAEAKRKAQPKDAEDEGEGDGED